MCRSPSYDMNNFDRCRISDLASLWYKGIKAASFTQYLFSFRLMFANEFSRINLRTLVVVLQLVDKRWAE